MSVPSEIIWLEVEGVSSSSGRLVFVVVASQIKTSAFGVCFSTQRNDEFSCEN